MPRQRLVGLDLARALAVFGMVVVNFEVAMVTEGSGPGWLATLTGLLHGRAAATFVVLAGVGISLLTRRARESGERELLARDRNTLLRRALFLFVVGALYTPIWPADILHFYGVYIAAAALLLRASSAWLWRIAALLVTGFYFLLTEFDYEAGWNWETLEYAGLWTPIGALRHVFYNGFHPVVPWLAFLLVGMTLGRLDLNRAKVRRRLLLWGASTALAAELGSRLLIGSIQARMSHPGEAVEAVFGTAPVPPAPLYMVASTGTACAVIAVCLAVGLRWSQAPWLRPLVATGQLALTLYVAHVLLGMGTLEALGRLEDQKRGFSLLAALAFCAAAVLFAHLWRKHLARGPLEAVMRRLTDPREPAS